MYTPNKNSGKKSPNRLLQMSLQLYADFYPMYYLLETLLKNRLYYLLKEKLGDSWFTIQLNDESNSLFKQQKEIILLRKPNGFELRDNGLLIESGFGIWVEFFNKQLYKETKGLPIHIFPNLPANIKRKDLYVKLNKLKEIRNQLFHFKIPPITKSVELKYLDQLLEAHNDLMHILTWLDAPIKSTTTQKIERKANLIKKLIE